MGALLFHRYEVVGVLGEGAQSKVYLVRDTLNENTLKAAKVIKAESFAKNAGDDLVAEFHLLESVDHPNLVRVLGCQFLPEDRAPVVITEYLPDAVNLEVLLQRGSEFSFQRRLEVAYQILLALRYLHRKKIIHGDLKPSNILIAKDAVKLIDFGVSHDLLVTKERKCVGTPFYIAPEGVSEGLVFASDLYSFGVILYRLFVAEKLPYQKRHYEEILSAHLAATPLFDEDKILKSPIPGSLRDLIAQCLRPEPQERPKKLSEILRTLRFEFCETLEKLPAAAAQDARLRQVLGKMQEALSYVGREWRETLFPVLFVMAPSGGGKTRFLQEVVKVLQRDRTAHFLTNYRPGRSWEHLIDEVSHQFRAAQATWSFQRRMQGLLNTPDVHLRRRIFLRYLYQLADEVGGLVLLIDGLNQQLPFEFYEGLEAIAKRGTRRGSKPALRPRLRIVLSVTSQILEKSLAEHRETIHRLNQFMLDAREEHAASWTLAEFQRKDQGIPEQVRILKDQGLCQVLTLGGWQPAETRTFLQEVFDRSDFSPSFLQRIHGVTDGNPGLLQAITTEALRILEGGSQVALLEDLLLEISQSAVIHDLQVYKLKYYDTEGRALLAFVAALESVSRELLQAAWSWCFGEERAERFRAILSRAFDDGMLMSAEGTDYALLNRNLKAALEDLVRGTDKPVGAAVRRMLHFGGLSLTQRIYLARFLHEKTVLMRAVVEFFERPTPVAERLPLADTLQYLRHDLRRKEGFRKGFHETGEDVRLKIEFFAMEVSFYQRKFNKGEEIAKDILYWLAHRNDPFGNTLRVRTQFWLGKIKVPERGAIDPLREAVESELLSDRDHFFASGSLALCELYLCEPGSPAQAEWLETLQEARRELQERDAVLFGVLTANLGEFYATREAYEKAFPYWILAERVLGKQHEVSRQLKVQKSIGKAYFLLGRHESALEALDRVFISAERLGQDMETMDALVLKIKCLYESGQFRKIAGSLVHLTSICERLGSFEPLEKVLEHVVHALLEQGKWERAFEVVQRHRERLQEKIKGAAGFAVTGQMAICNLLLVKIHQVACFRPEAEAKWRELQEGFMQRTLVEVMRERLEAAMPRLIYQSHLLTGIELCWHVGSLSQGLARIQGFLDRKEFLGNHLMRAEWWAFKYAVWNQEHSAAEALLPICQRTLKKLMLWERMEWHVHCGKFHLDRQEKEKAAKALHAAKSLCSFVTTHHEIRGMFFDQLARLIFIRDRDRATALKNWHLADLEFEMRLRILKDEGRKCYQEGAPEYREHLVIGEMLEQSR